MPTITAYDKAPRISPEVAQRATERVIQIRRIAKVTAGGKTLRFNALVALGDGQGHVGIGLGKADAVPDAVRKGVAIARKNMIRVPMKEATIPHEVLVKYRASKVLLKPAVVGTGVVAGATVRAIMELAGVRDILTKSLGNHNPINLSKATMEALATLRVRQAPPEQKPSEASEAANGETPR